MLYWSNTPTERGGFYWLRRHSTDRCGVPNRLPGDTKSSLRGLEMEPGSSRSPWERPRSSPERPKSRPRRPRSRLERPKIAPRASKRRPRDPKRLQEAPRGSQEAPRGCQEGPRGFQEASKRGFLTLRTLIFAVPDADFKGLLNFKTIVSKMLSKCH